MKKSLRRLSRTGKIWKKPRSQILGLLVPGYRERARSHELGQYNIRWTAGPDKTPEAQHSTFPDHTPRLVRPSPARHCQQRQPGRAGRTGSLGLSGPQVLCAFPQKEGRPRLSTHQLQPASEASLLICSLGPLPHAERSLRKGLKLQLEAQII